MPCTETNPCLMPALRWTHSQRCRKEIARQQDKRARQATGGELDTKAAVAEEPPAKAKHFRQG